MAILHCGFNLHLPDDDDSAFHVGFFFFLTICGSFAKC